jgi:hypothetical protein
MAVSPRRPAQDGLGLVIPLEAVLERFQGVRRKGSKYIALCPSHPDREPSVEITMNADGTRILIYDSAAATTPRSAMLPASPLAT